MLSHTLLVALGCAVASARIVDVQVRGAVFVPDVIHADIGDIVEFSFLDGNHSVVRGDFASPCIPYQGINDFFSGFLPGSETDVCFASRYLSRFAYRHLAFALVSVLLFVFRPLSDLSPFSSPSFSSTCFLSAPLPSASLLSLLSSPLFPIFTPFHHRLISPAATSALSNH